MRFPKRLLAIGLALTFGAGASAQTDERYVVRGHVFYANPTGDLDLGPVTIEADEAFGFDLGWEFLYGSRLGFNFTIGFSDHDIEPTASELEPTPVTGTILFHVTPDSRFDVYVGPGIAVVFYDDIGGADVETDLAVAFQAGVDVPLEAVEGLSLSFDVRYIGTTAEIDEGPLRGLELDVDPFILGAGVAYRF